MKIVKFRSSTSRKSIDRFCDCHRLLPTDQKENIVIIGASGHAKVIIDIVQQEGRFNIAGLVDQSRHAGERILGCPVLGKEEDLPELIKSRNLKGAIIAVGDNFVRSKLSDRIRKANPELPFVSAVHPSASIATDVSIGEGTVVMAGTSVGPCSSVGRFCILNTNCSLDHDSVLEDFASLAPRATTGGNCRIGKYSAIGIGAVLIHGIKIGKQSVVGAGSLVMEAVASFVVAYGTPAKAVRNRKPGDSYLTGRASTSGQLFCSAPLTPVKGRRKSADLEKKYRRLGSNVTGDAECSV